MVTKQSDSTYRTITVQPINSYREALYVLALLSMLCLFAGGRYLTLTEEAIPLFLQPYHRLDTRLNTTERPLYQALLTSQNEILLLWEDTSEWPTVELINKEGIPPFASDLMPGKLQNYTWTTYNRGQWVDYLGINIEDGPKMPSALLRIIDLHADFHPHPHPGRDYDPNQKTAVQIWMHPSAGQRYAGMQLAERGWFWIISPDNPILKAPQKLAAPDAAKK